VDIDPAIVVGHPHSKGNPLRLFTYNGKTYVTGLFAMHNQEGFSLTDSILECKKRGSVPCVQQFYFDAIRAGWTKERARQVVDAAVADAASFG
jgi:hypothetical protein